VKKTPGSGEKIRTRAHRMSKLGDPATVKEKPPADGAGGWDALNRTRPWSGWPIPTPSNRQPRTTFQRCQATRGPRPPRAGPMPALAAARLSQERHRLTASNPIAARPATVQLRERSVPPPANGRIGRSAVAPRVGRNAYRVEGCNSIGASGVRGMALVSAAGIVQPLPGGRGAPREPRPRHLPRAASAAGRSVLFWPAAGLALYAFLTAGGVRTLTEWPLSRPATPRGAAVLHLGISLLFCAGAMGQRAREPCCPSGVIRGRSGGGRAQRLHS